MEGITSLQDKGKTPGYSTVWWLPPQTHTLTHKNCSSGTAGEVHSGGDEEADDTGQQGRVCDGSRFDAAAHFQQLGAQQPRHGLR